MYIHERKEWPEFHWDQAGEAIKHFLSRRLATQAPRCAITENIFPINNTESQLGVFKLTASGADILLEIARQFFEKRG